MSKATHNCPLCKTEMEREEYDDGCGYWDIEYTCLECGYSEWHTEHNGEEID